MDELALLLQQAATDERASLAKLLKEDDADIRSILNAFQRQATSLIDYRWRGIRPSSRQIVLQVLHRAKIEDSFGTVADLELRLVKHLWNTVWEKMTAEQRADFNMKLEQAAKGFNKRGTLAATGLTGASLLGAQVSGFGIYLLASSTLGAITTGLGITLPFVAYTIIAKTISIVIGPFGWAGLGLLTIHKLTGPNYASLTQAIVMVHCIRARLHFEQQQNHSKWIVIAAAILALAFVGWQLGRSYFSVPNNSARSVAEKVDVLAHPPRSKVVLTP